ncbi:class I SAM-dependent methyltransferase [Methanosarcina vacuolata]|nr:methyltransferase domain-containing protein [Methanosarcina vacuolata]
MKEPRGQELIDRYKKNYHMSAEDDITEEMILKHWNLEKTLTSEILKSNSENRWEITDRCYTTLYRELWWLNKFTNSNNNISPSIKYKNIIEILGYPPKKIYEIGSGKAELITYLASCGFECKATEITRERGGKYASEVPNLSWGISDGIHLNKFEKSGSYDVVISDQVIEHLHPDDIIEHFKNVNSILSSEGKYIFITPHKHMGPADISRVFKCEKPFGMHLKEYTYKELKNSLEKAGFKDIYGVFHIPNTLTQLTGVYIKPKVSSIYLTYSCAVEQLISLLPYKTRRKAMIFFFVPDIFMIAQKK